MNALRSPLWGIVALFTAMILGALASDPAYSTVSNTTSELAGQGMPNAWIMRAGFAAFGLAAILSAGLRLREAPLMHLPVILFGLGMIGVAIWSAAPLDPALAFDAEQDRLHSLLASGVGFAFALACGVRIFLPGGNPFEGVSWLGLIVSIAIPLAMTRFPEIDGVLQRIMFAVSALWLWQRYGTPQVQKRTE